MRSHEALTHKQAAWVAARPRALLGSLKVDFWLKGWRGPARKGGSISPHEAPTFPQRSLTVIRTDNLASLRAHQVDAGARNAHDGADFHHWPVCAFVPHRWGTVCCEPSCASCLGLRAPVTSPKTVWPGFFFCVDRRQIVSQLVAQAP